MNIYNLEIVNNKDIEQIIRYLISKIESSEYKGWDPYDFSNSPLSKYLPFSNILLHIQRFSPVNARVFLRIPKDFVTKVGPLAIDSYINMYEIYEDDSYIDKAQWLYQLILEKAVVKNENELGWGRNFTFKTKGEFHSILKPMVFLNVKTGLAFFNLYQHTHDEELLFNLRKIIVSSINTGGIHKLKRGTFIGYSSDKNPRLIINTCALFSELLLKYISVSGNKDVVICDYKLYDLAQDLINTIVDLQYPDGSWEYGYSKEGKAFTQKDFHQGFIVDSLKNSSEYVVDTTMKQRILHSYNLGFWFLENSQIDDNGAFLWRYPQKYPIDIHNQAQGIITLSNNATQSKKIDKSVEYTIKHFWDVKNHYFYYQKIGFYINKIHYIRWSSAWMLFALTTYLKNKKRCAES